MSKYLTKSNGFRPNTPELEIKKVYAKIISEEGLSILKPISNGIFGIQIPVWPQRFKGTNLKYVVVNNDTYRVKLDSTIEQGYSFKVQYHNIPLYHELLFDTKKLSKNDIEKAKEDRTFDAKDFDSIPFKFYVLGVSKELEDKIKPGEVVILRPGSGGISSFNYNSNVISFIPVPAIMGKEDGGDHE